VGVVGELGDVAAFGVPGFGGGGVEENGAHGWDGRGRRWRQANGVRAIVSPSMDFYCHPSELGRFSRPIGPFRHWFAHMGDAVANLLCVNSNIWIEGIHLAVPAQATPVFACGRVLK
jgi:hypothetical protein